MQRKIPTFIAILAIILSMAVTAKADNAKADPAILSLKNLSELGVRVQVINQFKSSYDQLQDDIKHSDIEGKLRDEGFKILTLAELDKATAPTQFVVIAVLTMGDKGSANIDASAMLFQGATLDRDPSIKTLGITWMTKKKGAVGTVGVLNRKIDSSDVRAQVRAMVLEFVNAWKKSNSK